MSPEPALLPRAAEPTTTGRQVDDDVVALIEGHRQRLTYHCRRLLGSSLEAEDAVQETLIRAWRRWDGFEGRAALYTWLYRIATNVCLDMLRGPQRRARPGGLTSPGDERWLVGTPGSAAEWRRAASAAAVESDSQDPAERAVSREAIRLALVVALRALPRRQRAALVLCDVLRWTAQEAAELLDTTVPAVNSALQRARARLAAGDSGLPGALAAGPPAAATDPAERELLAHYVDAFDRTDLDALVALL